MSVAWGEGVSQTWMIIPRLTFLIGVQELGRWPNWPQCYHCLRSCEHADRKPTRTGNVGRLPDDEPDGRRWRIRRIFGHPASTEPSRLGSSTHQDKQQQLQQTFETVAEHKLVNGGATSKSGQTGRAEQIRSLCWNKHIFVSLTGIATTANAVSQPHSNSERKLSKNS